MSAMSHPLAAEAAAWRLDPAHLAITQAEGAPLLLLIGSLGAAALRGSRREETLQTCFSLDAAALPGIGARHRFAGVLNLTVAPNGGVRVAQVQRLEWRGSGSLFSEVPFSPGSPGIEVHDGAAGRVAAAVAQWVRSAEALPALRAAALAGIKVAEQAAAVAREAAARNAMAARRREATPDGRAHHLWWAGKREDEAERQLAVAAFLRRLEAGIAERLEAGAPGPARPS